ncbi:hypothetical protein [Amycolatopsis sp. GM8]|uniref:hypothetical protein n=1 Tax=Amycolatopsis sp. GM8 TaxID=2896530 RepID=UPI001F35C8E3|nr:hypothetical protein [Amycolatopsis sp. GM8]
MIILQAPVGIPLLKSLEHVADDMSDVVRAAIIGAFDGEGFVMIAQGQDLLKVKQTVSGLNF